MPSSVELLNTIMKEQHSMGNDNRFLAIQGLGTSTPSKHSKLCPNYIISIKICLQKV